MKAPRCPKCKEPLEIVRVLKTGVCLSWNYEKGCYEEDDALTSVTFYCENCMDAIGGWRAGEHWGFIPEFEV